MDKRETIGKRFEDLRTSQTDKYGKELPVIQMAQKLIDTQCITNYSADVIRQEISKVEKGKFPQLYLIKGYSKYFNVTSDYLLGLRETKTVDENIAMINRITRLNENAINVLKKLSIEDITILNFIMQDSFSFNCFISHIRNYISGCYDTPIYFERGKNGKGYSEPKEGVDIITESPIVSDEEKQFKHIFLQNSSSKNKEFISIPTSMVKTYFLDCIREILEIWIKEYGKK